MTGAPKTRADCINGLRPCPWTECRYHLAVERTWAGRGEKAAPARKYLETCALDMAQKGPLTLDQIATELGGITRERVRQIESDGLRKISRVTGEVRQSVKLSLYVLSGVLR